MPNGDSQDKYLSSRVDIKHNPAYDGDFSIKDPSIVKTPDGAYHMFATVITEKDGIFIGRFKADHPGGPWKDGGPVRIDNIEAVAPNVYAPSVLYEEKDGQPLWTMYVQTHCFSEDGVIAVATSKDGTHFEEQPVAMARQDIPGNDDDHVVGLYDVAVSDIDLGGAPYECMVFSGYREVGSGDVYCSLREKFNENASWSPPKLALRQEDVPFHNKPESPEFEWGLEGAKIVQLADDAYLMVGVCFLDKTHKDYGTRQRVFLAASDKPEGPYKAMDIPFNDIPGENGHPDTIDMSERLGILYQQREGKKTPWYLCYAEIDKNDLLQQVRQTLQDPPVPITPSSPAP